MLKMIALFSLILSSSLFAKYDNLVYGDYVQYFELGEVIFERSAGLLDGRESDYHVVVTNGYNTEVCLVTNLELIKNGRNEFIQERFILNANSETELGNYGAEVFGSSWHIKWDYFVSESLDYCEG
jgi:hypothetical protein